MPIQKFKVTMEVIDTRYYEKIFDFDSEDFYEPDDEIPNNMYEDIPELLEEVINDDFLDSPSDWDWNQPEIGSGDGFFIEKVELMLPKPTSQLPSWE
jgi:hypothetical protein